MNINKFYKWPFFLMLCFYSISTFADDSMDARKENDQPVEATVPVPSERPYKEVQVTASSLNVRTSKKAILCSVPRGTVLHAVGRHVDGRRVQVRLNSPGCPEYGFVDSRYLTGDLEVNATGLALRSEPKKERGTWQCALDNGVGLKPLGESKTVDSITWEKVELINAKEGCPTTGYVARSYLKSTTFKDLPILESTLADCSECNLRPRHSSSPATVTSEKVLNDVSEQIGDHIQDTAPEQKGSKSAAAAANRLRKAARKAAEACRSIAPHVCKRITGSRAYCGKRCGIGKSKGWCKQGVREAFESALGFSIPGGSALEAKGYLERKMTRLKTVKDCKNAPVGAVCLYTATAHNYGHIEIKTAASEYCSDYCSAAPIRKNHTLIGVYFPDGV